MPLTDASFFAVTSSYVIAAVILGVLSNRVSPWRILLLSAATMVGMVAILCADCLTPGWSSLTPNLTLLLMYLGGPLLIAFAVPFTVARYIARVAFRTFGTRPASPRL